MPRLLVSVRSAVEAEEALAGGAEVIDVKEPDAGPLGKATDTVCSQILDLVAGRRPVSAAMGEMLDARVPAAGSELHFVKWGLAQCAACSDWRNKALELSAALSLRLPHCRPVLVVYADHRAAKSPPVEEVAQWCIQSRMPVLMIDTFSKTGKTLLDWLSPGQLSSIVGRCSEGGVRLAAAGSLGAPEIKALGSLAVEWVGVRGAACRSGIRDGIIDRQRVAKLARCLRPLRLSKIEGSQAAQTAVSRRAQRVR